MSNSLRVIVWSIISLGMIFLAVMAFWVFLILLGVILIARFIYTKLFHKTPFNVQTFTIRTGPKNKNPQYPGQHPDLRNEEYTTVVDADDLDKEYKIPKIK